MDTLPQVWGQCAWWLPPVLLDAAIKGALLLLAASVATAAMRKASASARQIVWVLALAGMLVVPALSAVLPGLNVLPRWAHVELAPPTPPANVADQPAMAVAPPDDQAGALDAAGPLPDDALAGTSGWDEESPSPASDGRAAPAEPADAQPADAALAGAADKADPVAAGDAVSASPLGAVRERLAVSGRANAGTGSRRAIGGSAHDHCTGRAQARRAQPRHGLKLVTASRR